MNIVIPVLNEEKILREKEEYFHWLKSRARIIFVDGGSTDKTVELAKNYGDIVCSTRGRASQKNAGVDACQSENILFLHVDTFLNDDALAAMTSVLANGICGGCFTLVAEDKKFIFRIFERLVNFRAKTFKVIDGDLGLFVKRNIFEQLNRFDRVSVMEDILFSKKLRRAGKIVVLPETICVSSRKWYEKGF